MTSEIIRNEFIVSQMNDYFIFTKRLFLHRYVCPCFLLAEENSLELEEAKRFNRELQVRGIVVVVLAMIFYFMLPHMCYLHSCLQINEQIIVNTVLICGLFRLKLKIWCTGVAMKTGKTLLWFFKPF